MKLDNRVAIVTGGAVRVGRAFCRSLSQAGMRVCLHYNTSAGAAEQTAADIRQTGGEVVTVRADLSQPIEAADAIVSAAMNAFGRVDVLLNNASVFKPGLLVDLDEADWQQHHNINLAAPTFLAQRFAQALHTRPDAEGAIVNIVDWRAARPQSGHLAYTLSKAGLLSLTKVLAQELGPTIRVNAIAPGAILPSPNGDDSTFQKLADIIPLGRTGCPKDLTDAALYLLQADFVTGETIHVTGGQQLRVMTDVES